MSCKEILNFVSLSVYIRYFTCPQRRNRGAWNRMISGATTAPSWWNQISTRPIYWILVSKEFEIMNWKRASLTVTLLLASYGTILSSDSIWNLVFNCLLSRSFMSIIKWLNRAKHIFYRARISAINFNDLKASLSYKFFHVEMANHSELIWHWLVSLITSEMRKNRGNQKITRTE